MKKPNLLLSLAGCLPLLQSASAGLVAHYTFDNAGNLGANSGSATIPWAAFSGVTRSTNNKFGGGSGSFVRGTSQARTGSFAATAAGLNRFSVSVHVYANTALAELSNWPDFLSMGNTAGYSQFVTEATGPGGGISLYKFSSATTTDGFAAGSLTNNTWQHLGIVSDGTAVSFYVNGIVRGNPIPYTGTGAISAIGLAERYGSTTRGITTLLDDVAIYDEALTAKQMAWLAGHAAVDHVPQFTPYAEWALQIPYSARRPAWVDHDEDGSTNLAEYFFGTSPLGSDGGLITSEKTAGNTMVVRWLQLQTGANYGLGQNATLQSVWTPAAGIVPVPDPDRSAPDGYVAMKAEIGTGTSQNFFRVQATLDPALTDIPGTEIPELPANAELALQENWSSGQVDPARWYIPRKMWGQGNNGVTPNNVRIENDNVWGTGRPVLVCQANGDLYDGPVTGYGGNKTRVGGMVVTRGFYASGRYEVVMKIGGTEAVAGGPVDPVRPKGTIPAVWTYGYRYVAVSSNVDSFHPEVPLYNPLMKVYNTANEYWSEIDFPEFGKDGILETSLYNTYLQTKSQVRTFTVPTMIDGQYHTLTTDWRTTLVPIAGVTDAKVIQSEGFYWIQDKTIAFNLYNGNPLKRLGPNNYAVYAGSRADHYIDGKKVAENLLYVPSMAAQLTMGIWLPAWAGSAPWKHSRASFSSIRIWQFHDQGDVRGIITQNITNNY